MGRNVRRSNLSKREARISKKRRMSEGGGHVLRDPDISKWKGTSIGGLL